MKALLITLFILTVLSSAFGQNTSRERLLEVNKQWAVQVDADYGKMPSVTIRNEQDLVAFHLNRVDVLLRQRNTDHLSNAQRLARNTNLEHLHQYLLARRFPINDLVAGRRPVFIDRYNTFCAVGYLIKVSGHEALSRKIAGINNLAYVDEMQIPELAQWAFQNGFTKGELALIQPSYGSGYALQPIGGGTNGSVREFAVSGDSAGVYVGGLFDMVDGSLPAQNIAYLTKDSVYHWNSIGLGTNNMVRAIVIHNDTVFIGGDFTEADNNPAVGSAFWDGSAWQSSGCMLGEVHDLISHNGTLYAVGDFDVCTSSSEINFARRYGNSWIPIAGLEGHVNHISAQQGQLVLAGLFSYQGSALNIISYDPATNQFTPFNNGIESEVNDVLQYGDTLYAASKGGPTVDKEMLHVLRNGTWINPGYFFSIPDTTVTDQAIITLCNSGDGFYMGGYFNVFAAFYQYNNSASLYTRRFSQGQSSDIYTDSTIHKMIMYKGEMLVGGDMGGTLNSIGRRIKTGVYLTVPAVQGKPLVVSVWPNPSSSGGKLFIETDFQVQQVQLYDALGRIVFTTTIERSNSISLPVLNSGQYSLLIQSRNGEQASKKLSIR